MKKTEIIAGIFGPQQKGKRLVWNGFKPDGTKNQYWQNQDIDWELHLSGQLKQGGNLSYEGKSKAWVIDIDEDIAAEKICEDAWLIDNKTYPFKSPSKRWHIWKFWHKDTPTKDIVEDRKKDEKLFKNKKYKIDFGHSLPKENGSLLGINFPFNDHQLPYDPRGNVLTIEQFIHRYRFQNYPLIAAATGLKSNEGGRPATLCKIAALLEKNSWKFEQLYKFEYLDDVIKNFGDEFTDTKYIERIKLKGIHKKYINIGPKGISEAISDIVGFDYVVKDNEPTPPKNLFEGAEQFEDFQFNNEPGPTEHEPGTKNNKIDPSAWRQGILAKDLELEELKPIEWVVEGLIAPGLNLIAGKSKIGKSWLVLWLAYAVEEGLEVLGFKTTKGKVLHYSLEDGKSRTKNRWKVMGIKPQEANYQFRDRKPKIPLLTMGLEEEIEDWIKNTQNAKLVIIDVYVKVKKTLGGHKLNAYENDNYNLQDLQTLATKYEIAIVLVHHLKKIKADDVFDEITGSAGIQSNMDSMIVISSDRKKTKNPILNCIPKDAEPQDFEIALNGKCIWENLGTPGAAALTNIQRAITQTMNDQKERTPMQIILLLQENNSDEDWGDEHIRKEITRSVEKGTLFKTKRGHYKHVSF